MNLASVYKKNELHFSLLWIAAYVVLLSVADSVSKRLGTVKIITAPMCVVMAAVLWSWLKRNGLTEKYGLCRFRGRKGAYLYFIPLAVIASTNLWNGAAMRYSAAETVLYVVSMICVGAIEEIIFRGFLFLALCRENVRRAIILSSVTFGIGHIVNLLNGAEVLSTLLQICYACAIGFLFTIIFYKGKSLVPCIITHSANNSLSAFSVAGGQVYGVITAVVLSAISVGYAVLILRQDKTEK